ncbi:MAG: hypothetical protein HY820_40685 [Acidobacteria bacterium]|nr:hypothetical protein [Acidobacteriota bacterium]
MKRCIAILFLCAVASGQEAPPKETPKETPKEAPKDPLLTAEGRQVHDVNQNDTRLLAILARGLAYEAEKKGTYDARAKALFAAATQAYAKQDWNLAWRLVTRLITMLNGATPDESTEVAAAYQFVLSQRVFSYADSGAATVFPIFTFDKPLADPYSVTLTIRDSTGKFEATAAKSELRNMESVTARLRARGLPPGRYILTFELKDKNGRLLSKAERDFINDPELRTRLHEVRLKMDKIAGTDLSQPQRKAAWETLEYIHGLLARAMKEYVADMNKTTHPLAATLRGTRLSGYTSDIFKLPQDLEQAEAFSSALLAGKNPLETRAGDLRMAHKSETDGTLQPYRIFLPQGYSAARKYPLIVALHGATGDENTYMDRYNTPDGKSLFKTLAQQRGYILVTPNGRGPFGMYIDNSEKDVLEVIDRVTSIFSVNPEQVFLTGHSMGGGGTWQIGFRHAKRFRGLAPVASGFGGRMQAVNDIPLKDSPNMPVLYSYGMKDTIATPEASKKTAATAAAGLKNLTVKEYPDDHFAIGISSMTAVFDFFDNLRK